MDGPSKISFIRTFHHFINLKISHNDGLINAILQKLHIISGNNYVLLILIVIHIVTHLPWIFSLNYFTYGDWYIYPLNTQREYIVNAFQIYLSNSNYGNINLFGSHKPVELLIGLFGSIGLDTRIAFKFIYYGVYVLLAPLLSYLLFSIFIKSKIGVFVACLVYLFNVYIIVIQTGHLLVLLGSVFLLSTLYLYYRYFIEGKKMKIFLSIIASSFILTVYEFRIFYIAYFICTLLILYKFLFMKKEWKDFCHHILIGIIVLLLNLYWLLPIYSVGRLVNNEIFSRGLFGNSYFDIASSLTIFHRFWTGSKPAIFENQHIPFYFWLIPAYMIAGLYVARRNSKVYLFGIFALLGIFLTKQSGHPFSSIYKWLFDHLPGFNAFREASKFFIVSILSYAVLIGYFIDWLWKNWKYNRYQVLGKYILTTLIIVVFLLNAKPLITGEIGTTFVPRQMPQDYVLLNNFLSNQTGYFRTLWVPTDSRWGIYTNNHPKLSFVKIADNEWKDLVNYEIKGVNNYSTWEKALDLLKQPYSKNMLDNASAKYVIVPIQDIENDDDFFKYYGNSRNNIIKQLNEVSYLQRISIDTKELLVYENLNYRSPIYTTNNVINYPTLNYFLQKNRFTNLNVDQKINFTVGANNPFFTHVSGLTDMINLKDMFQLYPTAIYKTNYQDNKLLIYQSDFRNKLTYINNNKSLQIFINRSNNLMINDILQTFSNQNSKETILNTSINPSKEYLLKLNDQFYPLNLTEKEKTTGIIDDDSTLEVYVKSDNLITNSSFEKGLWQSEVGDCHHYDDNSVLNMMLNKDVKSEGSQSLQLEATKHIACTHVDLKVQANSEYSFSFDYQSPNAKQVGYYLGFNDSQKTKISERINITDSDWHTFTKNIKVPIGSDSMTLYVYSYSTDDKTNITTRYDNFNFRQYLLIDKVNIQKPVEVFDKVELKDNKSEYLLQYTDENYQIGNSIRNHSFERGLWQSEVGDCHNYDSDPIIRMELNREEKSERESSLQLEATKHIACTGQEVAVKPNTYYWFSFDYQSPNAKQVGYYLGFNDSQKTKISERINITDSDWHTFTKNIKVPAGATIANLAVYSYSEDSETNIVTRYDNFYLVEMPNILDRYYIVSQPKTELINPEKIDYQLISPTKKNVSIKGASTSFFLIMNDSYDTGWKLLADTGKSKDLLDSYSPFAKLSNNQLNTHYKVNSYANLWYVDLDTLIKNNLVKKNSNGTYDIDMTIEYWPQRYFFLGLLISIVTLVTLFTCTIYLWRNHRHG